MTALLDDLRAESAVFDEMLAPLGPSDYLRPTPAVGWCIADQVSHLAFFDEAALLAAYDAESFRAQLAEQMAAGADPDQIAARYRATPGPQLRAWLSTARGNLLEGFAAIEPGRRLPWYGPEMSAASSVTARLMETWAHGQDVADALGITRQPTSRLRHVAHMAVSTIGFSFAIRGLPLPRQPIRLELAAPDGSQWTWGPEDVPDVVRSPAVDFCLVVTQRRHPADTALTATGEVARRWIAIAQAFAGPPGPGRPPNASPRRRKPSRTRRRASG